MQTLIVKDGVVVYIPKPVVLEDTVAYSWAGAPVKIGDPCPTGASRISPGSLDGVVYPQKPSVTEKSTMAWVDVFREWINIIMAKKDQKTMDELITLYAQKMGA